jgi:16S rRNA (adenine(1408)-N(1))-methyltransferase
MDYNLKAQNYEKKILDIGTGDGRFVYKSALENPNNLYIGIDPASNLKEYQREINRKKLQNAILINSSIENFKPEIKSYFNEINIILPWGNLLKYVVMVENDFFNKLGGFLEKDGLVEIIFGFNEELEERETKRLNLKELTENQINYIKQKYQNLNEFILNEFRIISNKELKSLETTWAKKLTFGAKRKYLKIKLKKT